MTLKTVIVLALAACMLACCCLWSVAMATSTTAATAATTGAAAAHSNDTLVISLGLIWDSEEAVINITSLSQNLMPSIRSHCPLSPRINRTFLSIQAFNLNTLPTTNELSAVVESLSASNFLFFGVKHNSVTQVLEALSVPTSLAEYPRMQQHGIAPFPQRMLIDALLSVISQRVSESQYPEHPSNYKAAMFLDQSVSLTELYSLFTYFHEGFTYYRYNAATLESDLLAVKYAQIYNVIVIVLDSSQGRLLRDMAVSLGMFATRYRWFIHGPRLINEGWNAQANIVSKNVTSIEFGRVNDALAKGIWSTNGALIFDLLSIWRPYLTNYLCDEKKSIDTTVNGFTGRFQLNPDGSASRLTWQLEIYSGLGAYREQVGEWTSTGKFEMLSRKDATISTEEMLANLQANTFRVATVISPPYAQYKDGVSSCAPCKDGVTGMYIEICKMILNNLGITNYEFWVQSDNAFGVQNGTSWNGVIRTVMDGKALLGCAPITMNIDRYKIVDFSQVIHSGRESLLFRKRNTDPISLVFQFIMPLEYTIWLSILAALIVVALVLFAMNWIAPDKDANFNLYNSIFFSFAEVVQGTSGTTPTQVAGRIVVVFFWFFTLFLFLSYIANYAVFRTLDGVRQEVTSISTLIESRDYDCGSIANTVTDSLLKSSAYLQMQQVYLLMTETFPNGSVRNMDDALSLIKNRTRNFVLINDNLQNQYYRDRGCDMINSGEFYDLKNALVLPKGNNFGHLIDAQIDLLAANITAIQKEFFTVPISAKESCYDGTFASAIEHYTPQDSWPIKPGALTLSDTLGIAVINLLGCCIAVALAGIERGIGRLQMRRSDMRRIRQVVKANELKFKRPTD